ncbi:Uncharacterised protein [Mycobacteroides abscessus subsp. abscessus]|uniref:hypothetical protein n=1 Tax=Mycobacteroides abscessus TaxID=36809 RepID=UPI000928F8B9|nr:hypothetical protein [Mycobacteroides abscessus]SHX66416.1 Uncharacterised protein [Mycobacteroides abscessus subsp. abscessus]SIC60201.1 Uncharacterised protein [Mycobacteroides abscessus subsp. abscessus]SKK21010.1 Uncharacterised protein [Mycobacteroides abscessus subsp. abscessus]SKP50387.1 Uncharacterised protein [Mycobacteroides abscessus subsp. abscessus]
MTDKLTDAEYDAVVALDVDVNTTVPRVEELADTLARDLGVDVYRAQQLLYARREQLREDYDLAAAGRTRPAWAGVTDRERLDKLVLWITVAAPQTPEPVNGR